MWNLLLQMLIACMVWNGILCVLHLIHFSRCEDQKTVWRHDPNPHVRRTAKNGDSSMDTVAGVARIVNSFQGRTADIKCLCPWYLRNDREILHLSWLKMTILEHGWQILHNGHTQINLVPSNVSGTPNIIGHCCLADSPRTNNDVPTKSLAAMFPLKDVTPKPLSRVF